MKAKPEEHILVIQLAKLGDYLQTTPLLSALKAEQPSRRLTVLCSSNQAIAASRTPAVDQVIPIDLAGLAQTAKRGRIDLSEKISVLQDACSPLTDMLFDRTINLNTSRIAALLADMAPATRREGPTLAPDRRNLNRPQWADFIMQVMTRRRLNRFNLVDLYLSYADSFPTEPRLVFSLERADREAAQRLLAPSHAHRRIGLQLGSRHPDRQWPVKQFAALSRKLLEDNETELVLLGTANEAHMGTELKKNLADDAAKLARVRDLMGKTGLAELAGVLSRLDLLITTDTGTMHLAAAMETPILALFMGPALVHETGPYGPGHTVIQVNASCSPCTEGKSRCPAKACRDFLEPTLVVDVADWVLKQCSDHIGLKNATDFIVADGNVQVWTSTMDGFGVVYHPLSPWPLDRETLQAIALRERGRSIIRPGYRTDRQYLASELAAYMQPVEDITVELKNLEKIADPAVRGLIPQSPMPRLKAVAM